MEHWNINDKRIRHIWLNLRYPGPPHRHRGKRPWVSITSPSAMSFLSHLVERIPEGVQRTEDTIVGPSFDS